MSRRALVTGAGGAIGQAVAARLASEGADIALVSRRGAAGLVSAVDAVKGLGRAVHSSKADLTQAAEVDRVVANAVERLGGLDTFVHVAGDYASTPLTAMTAEAWDAVQASNLSSAFYLARAAAGPMRAQGGGRMVFFASAGAEHLRARGGNAAYMIAKLGVIVLARSLAKELAPDGITVNVVSPGVAESSFEFDPGYQGPMPKLPMGRPVLAKEIADAVWGFVRPEAAYTTGQTIEVAGGWLL